MMVYGVLWMLNRPLEVVWFISSGAILLGLLLLAGMITPIAAAIVAVVGTISAVVSFFDVNGAFPELSHLSIILAATSIILLGPGAFSVDARVFGRRRIVIPSRAD